MTKILKKQVKCANCGVESEQIVVYSVNFSLGTVEDNEKLMQHKQVCPNCNYTAPNISIKSENNN